MNTTLVQTVKDQMAKYESILGQRDIYLLVDRSGSQGSEKDTPTGQTRWDYQQESLHAMITGLEQFDPDGITLVFFNTTFQTHTNITADAANTLLNQTSPMGGTSISAPVKWVLDDYLATRKAGNAKANGAMIIIVTDGIPSDLADKDRLYQIIAKFTTQLPEGREEMGILVIQNGQDAAATAFLRELDNDMTTKHHAKYDIVSVVTPEMLDGELGLAGALVSALSE